MADVIGYRHAAAGTQPEYLYPPYVSSQKRAPTQPLVMLPHTLTETTGPVFSPCEISANDADLTRQHDGESQGERIIVTGRVLDEDGRAIPNTLIEVASERCRSLSSSTRCPRCADRSELHRLRPYV